MIIIKQGKMSSQIPLRYRVHLSYLPSRLGSPVQDATSPRVCVAALAPDMTINRASLRRKCGIISLLATATDPPARHVGPRAVRHRCGVGGVSMVVILSCRRGSRVSVAPRTTVVWTITRSVVRGGRRCEGSEGNV